MNDIKAAFFDIDGTLLDFRTHAISQSTIDALKQLKKRGVKLAIATSRPYENIQIIDKIFHIPWDGIVGANGMEVRDRHFNLIQDKRFTQKQLDLFFKLAKQNDIPMYATGQDTFFTQMNDVVKEFITKYDVPIQTVKDYCGQNEKLLTYITYDKPLVNRLLGDIPDIQLVDAGPYNTDIFMKGINKATGIQVLMRHWSCDPHQYICFGDSSADEGMMKQSSYSVAMYDAMDSTKHVADYSCPEPSPDAISDFLKAYNYIS